MKKSMKDFKFKFEEIEELLNKYNEITYKNPLLLDEKYRLNLSNSFIEELNKLGGYLSGTLSLEDYRPHFLIIGFDKENINKIVYLISIVDIRNCIFEYTKEVAINKYIMADDKYIEKYKQLLKKEHEIHIKIQNFEAKRDLRNLFVE